MSQCNLLARVIRVLNNVPLSPKLKLLVAYYKNLFNLVCVFRFQNMY